MQTLLKRALGNTAQLWPALSLAHEWLLQVAHILSNHDQLNATEVQQQLEDLLATLQVQQGKVALLGDVVKHFVKVTANYAPGLFHTYNVPDLPPTNNDLEQCFGSVRRHERRATGRKGAVPGLVVRGPVRVLAAVTGIRQCFCVRALQLRDPHAWHALRDQLAYRHEARRMQFRFLKDPSAYLASLEDKLIKAALPS